MKILIVNGPNLNLLGKREPEIYGNLGLDELISNLSKAFPQVEISHFQSNVEGELINVLQSQDQEVNIILNAGGYTHTSVALRDCVSGIGNRVVEVHISNITSRESFRHESLISPVCEGCIFGFGLKSYDLAIQYFVMNP
ncbi:MAG: type II 3-dehydroquinate dehydratase [Crocinitomicaceae bacterium]|nr:type II 3-dehydroquinate dehydratase [Crocinitomicaceae bacterium]